MPDRRLQGIRRDVRERRRAQAARRGSESFYRRGPRPVRVAREIAAQFLRILVRNGPARLPRGFDFARGKSIGNGLELVASLLPSVRSRAANLAACRT